MPPLQGNLELLGTCNNCDGDVWWSHDREKRIHKGCDMADARPVCECGRILDNPKCEDCGKITEWEYWEGL